jgi:hypothetical protein
MERVPHDRESYHRSKRAQQLHECWGIRAQPIQKELHQFLVHRSILSTAVKPMRPKFIACRLSYLELGADEFELISG